VIGTAVQEITPTGEVVFEWRSWDHLPLSLWESEGRHPEIWDLLHSNAIVEAHNGHILLSMRKMSQIAKIDRDSGEVLWRLGGKGGNFRILNDTRGYFIGQHDVRDLGKPEGKQQISIFDNGVIAADGKARRGSRGAEYDLHFDSHGRPLNARLVNSYDTGILAYAKGSYRRMPNGNGVYCLGVGVKQPRVWTANPFYIEKDSSGRELVRMEWDLHVYRHFLEIYRAIKAPWIGTPAWPPTALLDDNNKAKTLRLHFSWNGATRLQRWRIVTGDSAKEPLTFVYAEVEKRQFKHWVNIQEGMEKCRYFQAIALDDEGEELSRSPVVKTTPCM